MAHKLDSGGSRSKHYYGQQTTTEMYRHGNLGLSDKLQRMAVLKWPPKNPNRNKHVSLGRITFRMNQELNALNCSSQIIYCCDGSFMMS